VGSDFPTPSLSGPSVPSEFWIESRTYEKGDVPSFPVFFLHVLSLLLLLLSCRKGLRICNEANLMLYTRAVRVRNRRKEAG
jgi:hypothetical protein